MRNLILAVALLFSTMTFAQTSAKTVGINQGATMIFAKTTVDYGTIAQGSDREGFSYKKKRVCKKWFKFDLQKKLAIVTHTNARNNIL